MNEYEEYLAGFCKAHHKTREEAEKMAIVREVKTYYEEKPVLVEEEE